jgi:hypothetical protein
MGRGCAGVSRMGVSVRDVGIAFVSVVWGFESFGVSGVAHFGR